MHCCRADASSTCTCWRTREDTGTTDFGHGRQGARFQDEAQGQFLLHTSTLSPHVRLLCGPLPGAWRSHNILQLLQLPRNVQQLQLRLSDAIALMCHTQAFRLLCQVEAGFGLAWETACLTMVPVDCRYGFVQPPPKQAAKRIHWPSQFRWRLQLTAAIPSVRRQLPCPSLTWTISLYRS